MRARLCALCFCGLVFCAASYAQMRAAGEEPYWHTLERGKACFRSDKIGDALLLFEDARDKRRLQYQRMGTAVVNLLANPEVRRLRDNLERIENYAETRGLVDAKEALDELYYRIGRETLGNSAKASLAWFESLRAYPEADFWVGEVYRRQGEAVEALQSYRRAYENRNLLERPGDAVTLLYRIAEMENLQENFNSMETALLEVLNQDSLWNEDPSGFKRRAMARTLENDGPDRFLVLYRAQSPFTRKAHQLLGEYYNRSGRHTKAVEHLMFSYLDIGTVVTGELTKSRFDYAFTTLDALMSSLGPNGERRPDLLAFLREAEFYSTLYTLAEALYAVGSEKSARSLWTFLASHTEAGQHQGMARLKLAEGRG